MTVRTRAPQGQFLLERLLGGDEGLTIEIEAFDGQNWEANGHSLAHLSKEPA